MKKRVLAAVLATMMAATMMAGCGKSETKSEAKKDSYTIGIEQFAEHGSLDNCREGFLKRTGRRRNQRRQESES